MVRGRCIKNLCCCCGGRAVSTLPSYLILSPLPPPLGLSIVLVSFTIIVSPFPLEPLSFFFSIASQSFLHLSTSLPCLSVYLSVLRRAHITDMRFQSCRAGLCRAVVVPPPYKASRVTPHPPPALQAAILQAATLPSSPALAPAPAPLSTKPLHSASAPAPAVRVLGGREAAGPKDINNDVLGTLPITVSCRLRGGGVSS